MEKNMKNKRLFLALGVLISITLSFTFGCGVPQSGNISQNQNQNSNVASATDPLTPTPTPANPCATTDPSTIARDINGFFSSHLTTPGTDPLWQDLKKQKDNNVFAYNAVVTNTPPD